MFLIQKPRPRWCHHSPLDSKLDVGVVLARVAVAQPTETREVWFTRRELHITITGGNGLWTPLPHSKPAAPVFVSVLLEIEIPVAFVKLSAGLFEGTAFVTVLEVEYSDVSTCSGQVGATVLVESMRTSFGLLLGHGPLTLSATQLCGRTYLARMSRIHD